VLVTWGEAAAGSLGLMTNYDQGHEFGAPGRISSSRFDLAQAL
jgi:hypothetical protein